MKLITHVEYKTVWGQDLFLRWNDRLFPMTYSGEGVWSAAIDRLKAGQAVEYRYEVHSGGVCIRSEWASHKAVLPSSESRS